MKKWEIEKRIDNLKKIISSNETASVRTKLEIDLAYWTDKLQSYSTAH